MNVATSKPTTPSLSTASDRLGWTVKAYKNHDFHPPTTLTRIAILQPDSYTPAREFSQSAPIPRQYRTRFGSSRARVAGENAVNNGRLRGIRPVKTVVFQIWAFRMNELAL
jgi:hypothetical protein